MERSTITRVTLDANGRRLLNQADPVTGRDVDAPPPGNRDKATPWAAKYPFASGFEVK